MIIGVGTDIVQIPRIERILKYYGDRFINKILNLIEIEKLNSINKSKHANFIAKRFAAKESVSKAFGSGIGSRIGFKDIIIMNDKLGKPFVKIDKENISKYIYLNDIKINISISDDYPVAIAFTILSK